MQMAEERIETQFDEGQENKTAEAKEQQENIQKGTHRDQFLKRLLEQCPYFLGRNVYFCPHKRASLECVVNDDFTVSPTCRRELRFKYGSEIVQANADGLIPKDANFQLSARTRPSSKSFGNDLFLQPGRKERIRDMLKETGTQGISTNKQCLQPSLPKEAERTVTAADPQTPSKAGLVVQCPTYTNNVLLGEKAVDDETTAPREVETNQAHPQLDVCAVIRPIMNDKVDFPMPNRLTGSVSIVEEPAIRMGEDTDLTADYQRLLRHRMNRNKLRNMFPLPRHQNGEHRKKPSSVTVVRLVPPFIKIEDRTRMYRPDFEILSHWPSIDPTPGRNGCIFQYDRDVEQKPQALRKEARKELKEFCHLCNIEMCDAETHLSGQGHRQLTASMYENLDREIAKGPTLDSFLREYDQTKNTI